MNKIYGFVMGDLHLGHRNIHIDVALERLDNYLLDNMDIIKKCSIIVLNGDIFDRLLNNTSPEYQKIVRWLLKFINMCSLLGIILRFLKGTETHEWEQLKIIETILSESNINIDFKYIDTMYLEKNIKLGLNILYIKDNYTPKGKSVYEDIDNIFKENQINNADMAFIHGAFNFQLPIKLASSYDEESMLKRVKYYTMVNHIHSHSVYKRIIAPGSTDRISHAEEKEEKGGILFTIDTIKQSASFLFIKNKYVKPMATIDVTMHTDITDIINVLDQNVSKLPVGCNVRILYNKESKLSKHTKEIKNRYPNIIIKIETGAKKIEQGDKVFESVDIKAFNITPDNIDILLKTELSKHNYSHAQNKIVNDELRTAMG
jgi:hypothetical protein